MNQPMKNPQPDGPGEFQKDSAESSAILSSSAAGAKAPVVRLLPNPTHPGVYLAIVACPFCSQQHTHGWEPGDGPTSPRLSHCAPANGSANRLARQRGQAADQQAILAELEDQLEDGAISNKQHARRTQNPARRLTEARTRIAKLERQSTRQDYTITGLPAAPTTTPAGDTK